METILKLKNNIFLHTENNIDDGVDGKFKILFSIFFKDEYSVSNKFQFFDEMLNNFWIKNESDDNDKFINYFYKIQKTYNVLNRFAYNYKFKKAKMVVNMDMGLNELRENNKNVMCIYHNNSKYLFYINDLLQIIKIALTNTYMFFSEPLSIKNPYNNIPFNKSTLYNIYFFIKYKTNYYEELFFRFFKSNFNLTQFKEQNEYILREHAIQHYVYKSASNILVKEIDDMIDEFNDDCKFKKLQNKITINKEFPKDKLIKIFQPYLLLYMIASYGFTNTQKQTALYLFNHKMKMFNNYNPLFGRKKVKIILENTSDLKRKIKGKIIEFDDNHITFNNIEKQNNEFLNDHLQFTDNNNINYNDNNDMNDNSNNTEIYIFASVNGSLNSINNNTNMNLGNEETTYNETEDEETTYNETEDEETKEDQEDQEDYDY
jgi:hypothetical protein